MATGPSTTQTPYLVSLNANVTFTSILSAGDAIAGSVGPGGTPFRMVGVPDGLGAFDNGDGTFTVLMNHEIGATSGAVRAHGSAGAFVSRLVIDKQTLAVQSASDLGRTIFTYNPTTSSYVQATSAFARLCSADLAPVSAYFDASTGLGTQARIFMNGEETGAEGRALGWVATGADAGKVYELARLGKFSWENSVASPTSGAKTVVIGTEDGTPGQVYVYVGDKQATGTEVDKAGLTNGKLYGIRVPAFALETNGLALAAAGTSFTLQEQGPNGNVSGMTGAQLQSESAAEGVTEFLRPEDGAWDTLNPNRFYFVTTNSATGPSRLWALDFTDVRNPQLGGTVRMLLNGSEGQVMMDNIAVTADGRVIIEEDVGNNARLGKVLQYDPATGILSQLAEHDPARFSGLTSQLPFNQDEEASGVIDVTDILGTYGKQVFLLDTQAHYTFPDATIVEGGQLQTMTIDRTIQGTNGDDTLSGGLIGDLILGREGNDRIINSAGNDRLDGGSGIDTAVFSDALTNVRFNFTSGPITSIGSQGVDQLVNFERFEFAGRTIDRNDNSAYVDDLYYNAAYRDVFTANIDADTHYAQFGAREGRDPNAFFDTSAYLAANSDVARAGVDALTHYATTGWREGRDPSALFDNEYYLAQNADVRAAGINPLQHYLEFGQSEGRSISAAIGNRNDIVGGFDREYYLLTNEDVARSGMDARAHFDQFGWREGRNPNAFFDTRGYLNAYADVRTAGVNPLTHYDTFGWREGRDPSVSFDSSAYRAGYSDVSNANIDPLQHFLQNGAAEGRSTFADKTFGIGNVG